MKTRKLHIELRPKTALKILDILSESEEVCKSSLGKKQLKVNICITKEFRVADVVVED